VIHRDIKADAPGLDFRDDETVLVSSHLTPRQLTVDQHQSPTDLRSGRRMFPSRDTSTSCQLRLRCGISTEPVRCWHWGI